MRNYMINVKDQKKELFFFLKKDVNSLNQYGWRNNIVLTGISDIEQDDQFEETVKFILSDTDINLDGYDIEDCHRVDNSDSKAKSKKPLRNKSIESTVRKSF